MAPDVLSASPVVPCEAANDGAPAETQVQTALPPQPAIERTAYYEHWDSAGIFGVGAMGAEIQEAGEQQAWATLQMSEDRALSLTDDTLRSSPDTLWSEDATMSSLVAEGHSEEPCRSHLQSVLCEARCKIRADMQNYYTWVTMRDLLVAISAAAVFANTSIDGDFHQ